MHQSITFSAFCDAFRDMDRQDQFTYGGKRCLFDYLEQYKEETDEPVELDVIALCCDYSEESWEDIADNYRIDLSDCEDDDERIDVVREYLEDHTMIVGEPSEGVFVYAAF